MKSPLVKAGPELSDAQLVALSRRGDRDAFGCIVRRYQSLVCAIAFSACGDGSQSEDIGQEVFLSAWRQIGRLREPAKLKAWLCGITRQTAVQAYRRQRREPAFGGGEVPDHAASLDPLPSEQALRREEEALVWRAIGQLDEAHREALVLYYREHRSIEQVAGALGLSEEAARQRLSRGRRALQEEVLKVVEGALAASAPGAAFTAAAMGALPRVAAGGSATAASALKGGLVFKGAAALGGILCNLAGPLAGMAAQLYASETRRQRRRILLNWGLLLGGTAAYVTVFGSVRHLRFRTPGGSLAACGLVTVGYLLALGAFIRNWARCSERDFGQPASGALGIPAFEYRSRATFLGLPLLHIRSGPGQDGRRHPAIGWVAVGRTAYAGLFAAGTFAAAPLSIGAVSVGLLALGGAAWGGVAFGGVAVGLWAMGALALGALANGGFAAGWLGAVGVAALAHHFAVGGAAAAPHANDPAAWAAVRSLFFFRHRQVLFTVFVLCSWLPLVGTSLCRRWLRPAPPSQASVDS